MRILRTFVLLVLAATSLFARTLPNYDAAATRGKVAATASSVRSTASAMAEPGTIPQVNEIFNLPTFLRAQHKYERGGVSALSIGGKGIRPEETAARQHLGAYASLYHLTSDDIASTPVSWVHNTGQGAIIVNFRQTIAGYDVFREEMKVIMDQNLDLLALSGFVSSATQTSFRNPINSFRIPPASAIGNAIADLAGLPFDPALLESHGAAEGGYQLFGVVPEKRATSGISQDIRMKSILFHLPEGLEPAYYIEVQLDHGTDSDYYSYVISAADGSILFRNNLTASDSYNYKVFASTTGLKQPFDSPNGNVDTPHPTGVPDGFQPPFVLPNLVSLQNGPISTNDPWLPPGSIETNGNNSDAYADLLAPDGFSAGDFRASITSPNTFDRTYDTSLNPNANTTQQMAAITQLFYDVNFFHDWYYDVGFDEISGNAQANNYGRGGVQGDNVKTEAQDNSGRNNANMSTPADGGRPRMQMFIFDGFAAHNVTYVTPRPGLVLNTGTAAFGPNAFSIPATDVVLVNDGVGTTSDGCETPFVNAAAVAGKIALIDRGICGFSLKAANAKLNGAIAVIIGNNAAGVINMAATAGVGDDNIATLSIGGGPASDTTTLKADLLAGPVQMTMRRDAALDRDGTIDNQIVAHEWCHYLSNRLIGNANGLSNNTGGGMGEGWSDFNAMLLTVRADDTSVPTNATFNGVYALAGYVEGGLAFDGTGNQGYYFGIRRVPYSTDMTKDPLSYRHIANGQTITGAPISFGADGANNAEVHNIGEVWSTMLWECYASLLRDTLGPTPRLTFDQARDRMRGYLVASLKMTPGAPTILEARDALLTAARANDLTDYGLFWAAFAKRGAGTEAQAPDRYSTTNTVGLVESAISGNDLVFSAASIVDSTSCDSDKSLDANETGTLGITLRNVGGVDLPAGATGTITSTTPGVTFPSGNTITFGSSTAGGTTNGGVQVALGPVIGIQTLSFQLSLSVPALPTPITSTANFSLRGNVDELPASSATEDFESSTTALPWTTMGSPTTPSAVGRLAFRRIETTPTTHSIFAPDLSESADVSFASPSLAVNTGSFSFSFRHRYQFEFSGTTFFDGGTIEISTDGGGTWTDIGSSIVPTIPSSGYTGTVALSLSTPFSGKPAFTGTSAGFPAFITTTVNLGTAFALKTVRIRFRAASDSNTGTSSGWEIDDVVFNNITNLPFTRVAVDPGCSLTRTTTTTLTSSPVNPVAIGQRFSVTASVTSSDGAIPSGAIQFTIPGAVTPTILATVNLNAAGQTTAIFTSGGAATFNFSANYIPAFPTKFGPSTSAATPVVVGQGTTTTVLASSLNPSTFGQSVTLTATVTAPGTAPTGTVTFRDGAVIIGAPVALAGGAASVTLTGATLLSGGSHSLSATYNGATCCTSSVGNLTQTVNPATTATTVSSSHNISSAGSPVTFTATVGSGVLGTITGTVNFMDGVTTIGSGIVSSGVATFTTSTLTSGSHSISAVYAGDGNFAPSTSASIPQVVSGLASLTLSAPSTAITGVSFSVTVTVRDAANNVATGYTGTVHFSSTDGAAVLPANYTFLAGDAGTHTFTVTLNTGGIRSITATDTVTSSLTSTATLIVNPAVIFARNDFNGDHLSDIIWQHLTTGQVVEWQMNGNVTTSNAVVDNPLATWVIKATGDFDGDGNADIILQNTATNAVAEWRMNGNVIVNGTIFNTPAAGWSVVATGDFNGDGKSDILLQNSFTGQVAEWQMNGSTITLGVVIANPGTAWSVKATGDFNGDGKSDILLQNTSTGQVAEWQMDGTTITSGLAFAAPGTTWVVKGTGDLDADGRSDIVLQNTTTGSVAEWLMNGNVITGGFVIGEPGLSSDVKGTADFDGDGRADIVLQNTSTNDVTIWQMNGRSITSSATIGSPGTGFVPIVK